MLGTFAIGLLKAKEFLGALAEPGDTKNTHSILSLENYKHQYILYTD